MKLTRDQMQAVKRLYDRSPNGSKSYLEFRRRVKPAMGYVSIVWCGMYIGIEPDGYTHS